jgi:hypothetical protein
MPLDEDYNDYLKSAFADLANVGGRWGGVDYGRRSSSKEFRRRRSRGYTWTSRARRTWMIQQTISGEGANGGADADADAAGAGVDVEELIGTR